MPHGSLKYMVPNYHVSIMTTPFIALSALPTLSCPPIQNDLSLPLQCATLLRSDHFPYISRNPLLGFPSNFFWDCSLALEWFPSSVAIQVHLN